MDEGRIERCAHRSRNYLPDPAPYGIESRHRGDRVWSRAIHGARLMKRRAILIPCVMVVALAAPTSVTFAQRETDSGVEVDKDIALLRRNLRAEKKKLIAANVPLTETEATKFWPVYDQYAAEMAKNNDALDSLIRDYAANQKTLTDAQASDMLKRWSAWQVSLAQTRQKYIPIVEKVLPGKKAAVFFQIDRRLYLLMDIQIASEIPLVIQ